jgi:hypothetical protein
MMPDPRRRIGLRPGRRTLVPLALLAVVGAVIAFQPALRWFLECQLTSLLEACVRIEHLRVSPFAGSLHVTNLALYDKQGGQPLLHPTIEIRNSKSK